MGSHWSLFCTFTSPTCSCSATTPWSLLPGLCSSSVSEVHQVPASFSSCSLGWVVVVPLTQPREVIANFPVAPGALASPSQGVLPDPLRFLQPIILPLLFSLPFSGHSWLHHFMTYFLKSPSASFSQFCSIIPNQAQNSSFSSSSCHIREEMLH